MAGNHRSGRIPLPAAVLKMRGTYRADRHAARIDLADGEPTKPNDLPPAGEALWDSLVPRLVALGIAKALDETALAAACRWYSVYREALAEGNGRNAAMAWRNCDRVLSRFGCTPADRARLRLESPAECSPRIPTRKR